MDLGLPCDITLYKALTDLGSLIAGILALIAGILAYRAGVHQANTTMSAAQLQISELKRQKEDEINNVGNSVRIEVISYVKYIIGTLRICEGVAQKTQRIPVQAANYVSKILYDSSVYPAVADRIGLLPHPQATVEFYMRIAEAKSAANVLATKIDQPTAIHTSAPPPNLKAEQVEPIADSLITALQLAIAIITIDTEASMRSPLEHGVQNQTLKDIDEALASARATFPNAESFKTPS